MIQRALAPNLGTAAMKPWPFCSKSEDDVLKLIAGHTAYICEECVQACVDILADDRRINRDKAKEVPAKR
jgi:ATP-dependent protease Clp ATPase subunit